MLLVLAIDYVWVTRSLGNRPSVEGALALAFLATQVGVCATWLAAGGSRSIVRVVASLALAAGLRQFLDELGHRADEELGFAFVTEAVTVVVILLGCRALGFRLMYIPAARTIADHSSTVPRYSIRDILIVTALVGAALATLLRMQALRAPTDIPLISSVVGVFLGAITLLSLLSTLVFWRATLPSLVTCASSLLLGWGIGKAVQGDQALVALVLGATALFQVTVFLLVRLAGYRFERPRVPAGSAA